MMRDAAAFVFECVRVFAREQAGAFVLSCGIAIALGGFCWWACTHYTKLWNLKFDATATHHAFCAFAALCTVAFTLAFAALSQAKTVAARKVDAWHQALLKDQAFRQKTYSDAYYAAKNAGLETFDPTKHFRPGHPKSLMPLNHAETRVATSKITGNAACANFRRKHPFLSRVLLPSGELGRDVVARDMRDWFAQNPNSIYKLDRGIDLAAGQIRKALDPNTPKVVSLARRYASLLFALAQAVPFTLIGYAAYRDLKETT